MPRPGVACYLPVMQSHQVRDVHDTCACAFFSQTIQLFGWTQVPTLDTADNVKEVLRSLQPCLVRCRVVAVGGDEAEFTFRLATSQCLKHSFQPLFSIHRCHRVDTSTIFR